MTLGTSTQIFTIPRNTFRDSDELNKNYLETIRYHKESDLPTDHVSTNSPRIDEARNYEELSEKLHRRLLIVHKNLDVLSKKSKRKFLIRSRIALLFPMLGVRIPVGIVGGYIGYIMSPLVPVLFPKFDVSLTSCFTIGTFIWAGRLLTREEQNRFAMWAASFTSRFGKEYRAVVRSMKDLKSAQTKLNAVRGNLMSSICEVEAQQQSLQCSSTFEKAKSEWESLSRELASLIANAQECSLRYLHRLEERR